MTSPATSYTSPGGSSPASSPWTTPSSPATGAGGFQTSWGTQETGGASSPQAGGFQTDWGSTYTRTTSPNPNTATTSPYPGPTTQATPTANPVGNPAQQSQPRSSGGSGGGSAGGGFGGGGGGSSKPAGGTQAQPRTGTTVAKPPANLLNQLLFGSGKPGNTGLLGILGSAGSGTTPLKKPGQPTVGTTIAPGRAGNNKTSLSTAKKGTAVSGGMGLVAIAVLGAVAASYL